MLCKQLLFTLTLFVAGLSSVWGQTSATPVDHFKCYQFPPADPLPVSATLQDQFDVAVSQVEQITFIVPFRFCTAVQKLIGTAVTPIVNPADHLDMYLINQQPVLARRVVVNNQFGTQTLAVSEARILAVPSVQLPATTPPLNLDHYKCYIASGPPVNVIATLGDEFQTVTQEILSPAYFCNPALKTHNGVVTPINNPLQHLTCYGISPAPFSGSVSTVNQFGGVSAPITTADMLCAPSQKLSWTAVSAAASAAKAP